MRSDPAAGSDLIWELMGSQNRSVPGSLFDPRNGSVPGSLFDSRTVAGTDLFRDPEQVGSGPHLACSCRETACGCRFLAIGEL